MAYRNHRNAASRPSIYQTVTDRIISSLKAGVILWEKPWKTPRYAGGPFPRNFYTGKPYRGINVLLLWSSDYSSPFWLTFKQAQELKGTVRKGEHGTRVFFVKQLQVKDGEGEEAEREGEEEAIEQDCRPCESRDPYAAAFIVETGCALAFFETTTPCGYGSLR